MSQRDKQRMELERRIAQKAIEELLGAGYSLGVNDGEDVTIANSIDAAAVLGKMFTTDEDYLLAYRDGKKVGWVRFVYGNSGWDVINDYTVNLEPALPETNALSNALLDEPECGTAPRVGVEI